MTDAPRDLRRALECCLGVPTTDGNAVTRLRNGVEIFPAMLEAIRGATHTIDLLTFIYWTGEIADTVGRALADRARAGVRVRVVLDSVGARHMDDDLVEALEAAGVRIHWFRPVDGVVALADAGERTHRKILIIDETVAFTGGVGIAQEWQGDARDADEWRDDHFRLTGPVVDGLRAAFLDDWAEEGTDLLDEHDRFPEATRDPDGVQAMVVRGASEASWSDIGLLKRVLCELAQERIQLTTAYFSPNDDMCAWLCGAARRGVAVRVLMPGQHTDKLLPQANGEANYAQLLEDGVEVYRYEPTMLHAKVMTVDGCVAEIGSANFNDRSVRWDEECDVVVFDPAFAAVLDDDFENDLRSSIRVTEADWEDRGAVQRVKEAAANVLDRFV